MKKILITGGPTNEYIDEVMKITNMSSGKIAVELAEHFVSAGYDTTLLITKTVKHPILDSLTGFEGINIRRFETTEDLYNILEELQYIDFDAIIHSAAVADYKPEFSFKLEDMAHELVEAMVGCSGMPLDRIEKVFLNIMKNPCCKVNDDTKISSVEPNLTVKLGLTPKIIKHLRSWYPNAYICGFKLLENVSQEELINAATKQVNKCNTNLCFANDLADLRRGNATRLVVNKDGFTGVRVDGSEGIFNCINIVLND